MGNGYFFADMCELYDYCKENVIKEAKAKFGKETVAEDISSEIFYKITEHSEWFFKLDGTKQKDYVEKIKDKVFTKYQKEWEQSYSIKFDEDLYGKYYNNNDRILFMEEESARSNFNCLSPAEKRAAEKRYIENKSISQIAKDEKTTENAVPKRLSRARNKIKSETGK